MANAADIIVNLVAKTGRFERGMDKGGSKLRKFGNSAKRLTATLGKLAARFGPLAVAAGAFGLARLTKSAIEANDKLGKMATTIGVSTERLRGLQLAAELAGVASLSFNKGLVKVSKAVVDAANGLTTYQRVFDRLNITTEELLALSPDEQLLRIGKTLVKLKSSTERTAAAYDLFGGRNVQMVNLLANSIEAIEATIEQAKMLGVALSDFDVARFEAANDQLTLIKTSFEGIRNTVALSVLPAILLFADAMIGTAESSTENRKAWEDTTREIVRSVGAVVAVFKAVKAVAAGIVAVGINTVRFALEPLRLVEEGWRQIFNLIPGVDVSLNTATRGFTNNLGLGADAMEGIVLNFKGLVGEMDVVVAGWDKAVVRSNEAADVIARQREELRRVNAELAAILKKRVEDTKLEAEAKARLAVLARIIGSTLTAEEKIVANIKLINDALIVGEGERNELIAARTRLEENLVKLAEDQKGLTQVGIQAVRNLQDAFSEFFQFTKGGFRDLLKSFVDLLRKMIAELLARQVLLSFFRAFAKPGNFASKVVKDIEGKALGGPLGAGQPAIVGERGPELFVPRSAGTVIPAGRFGGVSVMNNITINGADPERSAQILAPILAQNRQQTLADLRALQAKGRF